MRKISTVTISEEGRDRGKRFLITEMSARRTEDWAGRAIALLVKSGVDVGLVEKGNMAALANASFASLSALSWDEVRVLLDEMMTCVEIMPNPSDSSVHRPLTEDDVEEVATLVKLKMEVWKLHASFFTVASPSTGSTSESRTAA